MTKPRTKRKRPRNWVVTWYRAVGEFKNGERKMVNTGGFREVAFPSLKLAWKAKARYAHPVYSRFIRKKGERRTKIVEIQVNYPAE